MPFSSGTFSLYSPGNPTVTGTTISSSWANNTLSDIATGLTTCLLKDGTQTVTSNIPMSSFKFTGLAAGSASGDSARYGQLGTIITIGTEQASTSGAAIDFTGIPAGVRRITVMYVGVSSDSTGALLVQIGDSGGVEATGYVSTAQSGAATQSATSGFVMTDTSGSATDTISGSITLCLEDAANFTWVSAGIVKVAAGEVWYSAGEKALSAELDRVRVTWSSGNFDAGAINISYEGFS